MPPNRFAQGNATSPTTNYPPSNYNGFVPQFVSKPAEMMKSTIQEGGRLGENGYGYTMQSPEKPAFLSNTPTRRAPRMSEPLQDNNPPVKAFEFKAPSTEGLSDSPGQKRFRDPREF